MSYGDDTVQLPVLPSKACDLTLPPKPIGSPSCSMTNRVFAASPVGARPAPDEPPFAVDGLKLCKTCSVFGQRATVGQPR